MFWWFAKRNAIKCIISAVYHLVINRFLDRFMQPCKQVIYVMDKSSFFLLICRDMHYALHQIRCYWYFFSDNLAFSLDLSNPISSGLHHIQLYSLHKEEQVNTILENGESFFGIECIIQKSNLIKYHWYSFRSLT